jgi:hypothetical protein
MHGPAIKRKGRRVVCIRVITITTDTMLQYIQITYSVSLSALFDRYEDVNGR